MKGERSRQHSIRLNDQWRICFEWSGEDAYEVEIVDYHCGVMKKEEPIHPGEILLEEFLVPLNVSPQRLSADTGITVEEIEGIIARRVAISPNSALRLSLFFGLSERFWLNLQSRYDLETEKDKVADKLKKEVRILQAA